MHTFWYIGQKRIIDGSRHQIDPKMTLIWAYDLKKMVKVVFDKFNGNIMYVFMENAWFEGNHLLYQTSFLWKQLDFLENSILGGKKAGKPPKLKIFEKKFLILSKWPKCHPNSAVQAWFEDGPLFLARTPYPYLKIEIEYCTHVGCPFFGGGRDPVC